MRLNRVQRAGVVASVMWFLVASVWRYLALNSAASDILVNSNKVCIEAHLPIAQCDVQLREATAAWFTPNAWAVDALLVALIPILIVWPFAWVGVKTTRWVMAGRAA